MSYESRIYIVSRNAYKIPKTGEEEHDKEIVNGMVVASFDLCKVGYNNREFFDAFKTPIDYTLWLPTFDKDGNEVMGEVSDDAYGEHLKSADLQELIDALQIAESREHYRRFAPIIAMLQAFVNDKGAWNNDHEQLQAVHFGY